MNFENNQLVFFREVRDFFRNILGSHINTIDLVNQPVFIHNTYPFKTDGMVRPFGNGTIIENFTVVVYSLTPTYPFFHNRAIYNIVTTPSFELNREHIYKCLINWIDIANNAMTEENLYVRQKIDKELIHLHTAIQNQDHFGIEQSKKELEYLRKMLIVLQN